MILNLVTNLKSAKFLKCVCPCARARVCVCVCVCEFVYLHDRHCEDIAVNTQEICGHILIVGTLLGF